MVNRSRTAGRADVAHPVRRAAQVMGAIFLLIGILGFIPGITTNYGDMSFAGHNSDAKLLGLFQTSVLHNIVHLAFGVAGLAMSRTVAAARTFLVGGGAIYLVLWLYGLVTGNDSGANFIPFNGADDWLHFLLGVVMIALGLALTRRPATRR
ncbi:MAG: DUF4383 domain-containing protein [Micromonospora sp.]